MTHKVKIIVLGVVAIVSTGVLIATMSQDASSTLASTQAAASTATSQVGKLPNASKAPQRQSRQNSETRVQASPKAINPSIDPAIETKPTVTSSLETTEHRSLFVSSEQAKRVLEASGKLRQDLKNAAFLELDNERLAQLEVGDLLPIKIDELGLDYDIVVKDVREDATGGKTIVAQLPDQDFPHSTVLTLGEGALYANIVTPTGTYSMAGDGHNVWIAETGDLIEGVIQDSYDPNEFTEDESHIHDHSENGPTPSRKSQN